MDNKTVADLHRSAESMGLSIVSRDLPRDICGLYDDRHRLILLADWLNQRQRRCTLCHELIHARHHDPGCGTRYGIKCERRCRRETALALISPVDYGILLYLVVFRFGLTECLEIEKRWYFNAFAIL